MTRDFYELLGVDEDASKDEIRDAFREMVQEYHPDRNDDPRATAQFTIIKKAYDTLKDPNERQSYDRLGHTDYVAKRLDGIPDPSSWPDEDDSSASDTETSTSPTSSGPSDSSTVGSNSSTSNGGYSSGGSTSTSRTTGSTSRTSGSSSAGTASSNATSRSSTSAEDYSSSTTGSTSGTRSGSSRQSRSSTGSSTSSGTATGSTGSSTKPGGSSASSTASTASGSTAQTAAGATTNPTGSTRAGSTDASTPGGTAASDATGTATGRTDSNSTESTGGLSALLLGNAVARWIGSKRLGWRAIILSFGLYLAGLAHYGYENTATSPAMDENARGIDRLVADLQTAGTDVDALQALLLGPAEEYLLPAWQYVYVTDPAEIGPSIVFALGIVVMPLVFFLAIRRTRQHRGRNLSYLFAVAVFVPLAVLAATGVGAYYDAFEAVPLAVVVLGYGVVPLLAGLVLIGRRFVWTPLRNALG